MPREKIEERLWCGWKIYTDPPLPLPGIYLITCLLNGKQLVGETSDLRERLGYSGYIVTSRSLKSDLKKFGKNNFTVEVIEYLEDISREARLFGEGFYIAKLNTLSPKGYNIQSSSLPGGKRGALFAAIVSEAITKKFQDAAYKARNTASRQVPSVRQKINQSLVDAWAKGHDARVAALQTPEHSQKLSEAQKASYERDPSRGQAQSQRNIKRWADAAARKAQSEKQKRYAATPEGHAAKATNTGKIVINDGTNERRILPSDPIPEGWSRGRLAKGIRK